MNRNQFEKKIEDLAKQYEKTQEDVIFKIVQEEFEAYLKENYQDSEIWIQYAIFLVEEATIAYPEKAIEYLQQLLERDRKNIKALLILSDIEFSNFGQSDEKTFKLLSGIEIDDNESRSMIEYAKSKYYCLTDEGKYEECLMRSVNLYSKHVNNNKQLGRIYLSKGKIKEGCQLIKVALKNVICVAPQISNYIGGTLTITTADNFIDYFIKGIRTTLPVLEDMGELYIQAITLMDTQNKIS